MQKSNLTHEKSNKTFQLLVRTSPADDGTRFNELKENFPGISSRASLGQISSYLGITQQSLSRIRSKYKD